jgi:hypothetical protein
MTTIPTRLTRSNGSVTLATGDKSGQERFFVVNISNFSPKRLYFSGELHDLELEGMFLAYVDCSVLSRV